MSYMKERDILERRELPENQRSFAQCPNCGLELTAEGCAECAARAEGELAMARAEEYQRAKRELLKGLIRQAGGHCV